jgi:stage II sporulation protein GA (sporulation sigma-E factor processing peptidase)
MGDRMNDQPKVYADISFLVNFTMDFVILWATAKLSGTSIAYGRLITVSILGGIYGTGYLFPELSAWYSLPIKIIFSCLFVILAFWPRGWQEFKKNLLYFYGVSFVTAGAVIAFSYLIRNNIQSASFSYWWLLGGIFCSLTLGTYGEKYLSQKIIPSLLKYQVELHFGSKVCSGEGFLDTGNGLRDPLTQRPVVVAEYDFLKQCFPQDCKTALENIHDENDMLQALSQSSWANRLRIIPFSSIGQKNGLMVGFRCDKIVVDPDKINLFHKNLVVGVYLDRLSSKDNYQLLIPSEIVQKI